MIGSGGGGMDPLEPRVAKLEASAEQIARDLAEQLTNMDVAKLRTDMKDVRDRLAKIETTVTHLPTYGATFGLSLLILGSVAALIAFQGQISSTSEPLPFLEPL